MSLLAHRGKSRRRSRSGWWQQVVGVVRSAIGGRDDGPVGRRKPNQGSLVLAAGVLACLGTGYLLGNAFPWRGEPGDGGLKVDKPTGHGIAPGPIGEQEDLRPLAATFFLTAVYDELAAASAAARVLRQGELHRTRPREFPRGDGQVFYGLVVYFDGATEREAARQKLLQIPAPDATFASFREGTAGWPVAKEVR